MIKILFIMPYPEMADEIRTLLKDFNCNEELHYTCELRDYKELNDYSVESDFDIVIARGYSADALLKNNPSYTVQRITFNSVDAINAVENCKRQFNSSKIAIVGNPSLVYSAMTIKKICDVPIEIYSDSGPDTAYADIFNKALSDGCDTVISGRYPCAVAQRLGIPNYVARINPESLYQTIYDAVQSYRANRAQRIQLKLLQMVMDNSSSGYLFFDRNRALTIYNQYAADVLSRHADTLIGRQYGEIIPELSVLLNEVFITHKRSDDELFKKNSKTYTAHVTPFLFDTYLDGVLVDFQNINDIQEQEFQVRRKLASKGMVTHYGFENIIHVSHGISKLIDVARHYASVDSNIIIDGMTGSGKELFAQSIHSVSRRSTNPFVAVNCASIPENLLESELFGYAPGAFTGASKDGKHGLFELAHKGTLFLDEIAELPYSFQGKLLRVLQEHEIRRIGDDKVIPVDVRIIAATNQNLNDMVLKNEFRRDLYFRLNVLQLHIPALNERSEDIPYLFEYFLERYSSDFDKPAPKLSDEMRHILISHKWLGNVRELKNAAERFMVLYNQDAYPERLLSECIDPSYDFANPTKTIATADTASSAASNDELTELHELKVAMQEGLSRSELASRLHISRSTLWRKMKKYGLE